MRKQTGNDPYMLDSDVIKLLRQEHSWMVQMVKKELPLYIDQTGNAPGHYVSVNDLLDQLKRRAR